MRGILLRDNKEDLEKEQFGVIEMNAGEYSVNIELVILGSVQSTEAEPINIFRIALIKGSIKIILVHNHPSGNLKLFGGTADWE